MKIIYFASLYKYIYFLLYVCLQQLTSCANTNLYKRDNFVKWNNKR